MSLQSEATDRYFEFYDSCMEVKGNKADFCTLDAYRHMKAMGYTFKNGKWTRPENMNKKSISTKSNKNNKSRWKFSADDAT